MNYRRYRSRRRNDRKGPDFSRLSDRKRGGRLAALFVVTAIALIVGAGAYYLAGRNLKGNTQKAPSGSLEVIPTAVPTQKPQVTEPTVSPETELKELVTKTYGVYPDGFLADFVDTRTRTKVKGIYVNTNKLTTKGYPTIDELIALADETEINAMVIDIKDDYGNILYDSNLSLVNEMNAEVRIIKDLKEFVAKLKEHNIYCIARVVAMKDSVAVNKHPEFAIRNKNGTVFRDTAGDSWLNPYSEDAWRYLTGIAKEAVEAGFDEINFDYLRTSSSNSLANADFGVIPEGMTKMDAIIAFVKYACKELKPLGAFVSGDVFATIINSTSDGARIGQSYVELSRYLDYICPMVYPSHYNTGYGGFKYPDKEPFAMILMEMKSSVKKLSVIEEGQFRAEVRPWLQDFTASYLGAGWYIEYGAEELRQQISANYSAGYDSWLLWNAGMFFSEDGLLRDKDE